MRHDASVAFDPEDPWAVPAPTGDDPFAPSLAGREGIFDQALSNGLAAIVASEWPGKESNGRGRILPASELLKVIAAHGPATDGVVLLPDKHQAPEIPQDDTSSIFQPHPLPLARHTRVDVRTLQNGIDASQAARHGRGVGGLQRCHIEALLALDRHKSLLVMGEERGMERGRRRHGARRGHRGPRRRAGRPVDRRTARGQPHPHPGDPGPPRRPAPPSARGHPRDAHRRPHLRSPLGPHPDVPLDRTARRRPVTGEAEKAARRGLAETARESLQHTVRQVAALARDDTDFLDRLRDEGLRVRERRADDGALVGYSVALPGDRADGGTRHVWFAGSTLAYDLSLPRVRERFTPLVTEADWELAEHRIREASVLLGCAGQEEGAGDVAALSDLLAVAAAQSPTLVRD